MDERLPLCWCKKKPNKTRWNWGKMHFNNKISPQLTFLHYKCTSEVQQPGTENFVPNYINLATFGLEIVYTNYYNFNLCENDDWINTMGSYWHHRVLWQCLYLDEFSFPMQLSLSIPSPRVGTGGLRARRARSAPGPTHLSHWNVLFIYLLILLW